MNRTWSERRLLLRTLTTQVIEHERIRSTLTKCLAVRPLVEKTLALAKRVEILEANTPEQIDIRPPGAAKHVPKAIPFARKLQGMLTTQMTYEKALKELAPRFPPPPNYFTKLTKIHTRRKGDGARMAMIEIKGNQLEQEEKARAEEILQQIESGNEFYKTPSNVFDQDSQVSKIVHKTLLKAHQKRKIVEERAMINEKLHALREKVSFEFGEQITNQNSSSLYQQIRFFERQLHMLNHEEYLVGKDRHDIIKLYHEKSIDSPSAE